MELEDDVLYQEDPGSSAMMSERVSGLASSIYREFERMIGRYDEDVVKELMPLVVAVLENLDSVFAENQEQEVELELLKEDNEQLVTQYEREKALRKSKEERYIEYEDSQEQDKKDLQNRVQMLEAQTRQMELKTKNYADQTAMSPGCMLLFVFGFVGGAVVINSAVLVSLSVLLLVHYSVSNGLPAITHSLPRISSQQVQALNAALWQPTTGGETIREDKRKVPSIKRSSALLEELVLFAKAHTSRTQNFVLQAETSRRKERPVSLGIFSLPGSDVMSPDLHREAVETPGTDTWRYNNLSHPRSNTSLKLEANESLWRGDGKSSQENLETQWSDSSKVVPSASPAIISTAAAAQRMRSLSLMPPVMLHATWGCFQDELSGASVDTPQTEAAEGLSRNLDSSRAKPDSRKNIAVASETPSTDEFSGVYVNTALYFVHRILTRCYATSFQQQRSVHDLYCCHAGMGREVEHLIHENTQLLETKNALNVVKNDLIARVDELVCEKDVLQGELEVLKQAKDRLEERNKELEEELKKVRAELEEAKLKTKEDDDSGVPTAQRKRFTRVEMARVLMERNQYKERLMELQEAVRWTEMIRSATPISHMLKPSRVSRVLIASFSRLFSSSSSTTAQKPDVAVNMKYNAPSSHIVPSVKKRSSMLAQLPSDKSRAFDFLNEEVGLPFLTNSISATVQLPKCVANGGQADSKIKNLPVPVYLRPLDEKDASMKLWCTAGVNLSGGKTRDGGSIVGASVFYKDVSGGESGLRKKRGSRSSLERLEQELKVRSSKISHASREEGLGFLQATPLAFHAVVESKHPKYTSVFNYNLSEKVVFCTSAALIYRLYRFISICILKAFTPGFVHDDLSSLVWICTTTHTSSKVIVIDANQPGNILESFFVCNSHVLCIASVPGARETDYPSGEELSADAEAEGASEVSSTGSDGGLDGITVMGCSAEGLVAIPQTVCTNSIESSDTDEVAAAEEALEATESHSNTPADESRPGIYTEHVFADTPSSYTQRECDLVKDGVSSMPEEQDLVRDEACKMSSVLPTMWLGAQNGCVYVHSSVAQWRKCLHSIKLKDSVLGIVHVKGRVLVALADGTLAIFHRAVDGQWDLTNFHLLDLSRPHHSIRCMTVVHDKVWCGYRNKIFVVQPKAMKIEKSFDAHPRKESQVRQLAWDGDGIWVSIRLDSTLRLFHAHTHQHLQDIDIEPYVSKMLGTGKLGFSFVRITALMVSCSRLWVGTGNGVIISIPLSEKSKDTAAAGSNRPGGAIRVYGDESGDKVTAGTSVPFCSMAHAQLCFHGHRDAVKFFAAVPGQVIASAGSGVEASDSPELVKSVLVVSGGEGYIDFRMGDEGGDTENINEPTLNLQPLLAKAERSHLIVWQVMTGEE
ncbi:C-Jun-amino-terminal kinase-interacting protein 4-like [Sinocyclocheilus rhinocerous]|uniref:C-Jun-amino-terminal kinase-interacting protein 4-like n=1 Tax=Sinocyclocheilus rhinocerous TaxID=307959 RepID=UPI0007B80171|nr:PREDICTED: C-Jun-amino-terminal kinase-interacting protein 4-like [Sinocyclocheilus rhinocerous]